MIIISKGCGVFVLFFRILSQLWSVHCTSFIAEQRFHPKSAFWWCSIHSQQHFSRTGSYVQGQCWAIQGVYVFVEEGERETVMDILELSKLTQNCVDAV